MNSPEVRQDGSRLSGDSHSFGFSTRTIRARNAWMQCEESPNVHVQVMGRASGTLRTGQTGFEHCTVTRNHKAEKRGASIVCSACSLKFPDRTARVHRSDFHTADARRLVFPIGSHSPNAPAFARNEVPVSESPTAVRCRPSTAWFFVPSDV